MDKSTTIDLAKAPTEQLKAIAFDMILERDRLNANLDAIGQELQARMNPEPAEEPKTDEVTRKIFEATGGKTKPKK